MDAPGNTTISLAKILLCRSSAIYPSRRLGLAGVLVAIGRTGLEREGDVYLAAAVSCKGPAGLRSPARGEGALGAHCFDA